MKFLLRKDIRSRGFTHSNKHLLTLERAGKFPQRVYLSPKVPAWPEDEIDAHSERLMAERSAGKAA